MLRTRSFLTLCIQASQLGLAPRFEVGEIVGRGFADLGEELFQIMPGRKDYVALHRQNSST